MEHLARNRPTAEQIGQLLQIEPNSSLAVTVWEGLANGWPRDLTIRLSEKSQKLIRDRFLAEDTSVESKAAILAVADKWSVENLNEIVGEIQDELLTTALDADTEAGARLSAWDQSIRLAPNSPQILDASSRRPSTLPESVSIACSGNVDAIQLLGGVAWAAYPRFKGETTSMIVRRHYSDDTTSDFELINGKHIVTYQAGEDVPESTLAIEANGKQVRYLRIPSDADKELTKIEFLQGGDFSIPLVFAVTVEFAGGGH